MNNDIPIDEVMNVDDVAKFFNVHQTTVREWAKAGLIPCQKIGHQWFFNRKVIVELLGKINELEKA